jgi:hypothetical protein
MCALFASLYADRPDLVYGNQPACRASELSVALPLGGQDSAAAERSGGKGTGTLSARSAALRRSLAHRGAKLQEGAVSGTEGRGYGEEVTERRAPRAGATARRVTSPFQH